MACDSRRHLHTSSTRPRLPRPGVGLVRIAALSFTSAIALAAAAGAHIYQYDDTTSGSIVTPGSDNGGACPTSGTAVVNRNFTVPSTDSFTVLRISVALNVTSPQRDDLRVEILRPGSATPFTALAGTTTGGDDGTNDNNYDILMSSNSDAGEDGTAPVDDGDEDPTAAPFFNRLVTVSGIDFYTGNSVGTWTVRVCDRDSNGGNSTYNRARLILESSTAAGSLCTSRMSYNWGANGNDAGFTSASTGDVTITETTTTNFAGGTNDAGNGWFNFATDTDSLGGHSGYYSIYMDAQAIAGTQDSEVLGQLVTFTFSSAAQDLEFSTLDSDQANDDFEDIIRVEADAVGGGRARFGRTAASGSPSFQIAGDAIEGDSTCANTSDCATETYKFDRALTTVTVHYDAADDEPSDPGDQLVGISDFSFCAFDYGDAPNTYGDQLNSGPKHVLGNRELFLGSIRPDGEADGQPGANANTDDNTQVAGVDDEDGVASFGNCPGDGTYSVTVAASDTRTAGANATLVGYIDWNRDGVFGNGTNEESAAVAVTRTNADPSNYSVTWSSAPTLCGGTTATYARFRFTTSAARAGSPTDGAGTQAPDGEVEDYLIAAGTLPVTVAYVASERRGETLKVRWTTATETSNAGFRLWGIDGGGGRTLLATVRSRRPDSFEPQRYEAEVEAGPQVVAVQIEDVSLYGLARRHGPFLVGKPAGEEPEGAKIDWSAVRAETGVVSPLERMLAAESGAPIPAPRRGFAASGGAENSGLLLVREQGIHRVSYEQLNAAGIDLLGAQPDAIALLDGGKPMPRLVSVSGTTFGAGDFIEFVASPKLTLTSPVDAIELRGDDRGNAVDVGPLLLARGGDVGVVRAVDEHEADSAYSFSSPNGDPWYEQGLLAWGGPASLSRTFDLPDRADGPVILMLRTWGNGDFPGTSPDHHVVVRLNGTEIADSRFDGLTPWNSKLDVTDLVTESGNLLEVEVPGDTGFEFDYVAFDGYSVDYWRETVARGERFAGTLTAVATRVDATRLAGFVPGSTVTIWKPASPDPVTAPALGKGRASRGTPVAEADGSVAVAGTGEVLAATSSSLLTPGIVPGIPAPQLSSNAQYLIVTHPSLASSLGSLVALEQSRGFVTEVVTTDRIFAAHSDHASSAQALRSFLLASLAGGRLRYALLVGADTTDPWNHLGGGSISFVPTEYLPFAQYVTFSPTDEHLVDADGDGLADVPIGRLPVRTPSEVNAVVAKIVRWEHNVHHGQRRALIASGRSDDNRALADVADRHRQALSHWGADLAQVDHVGSPPARQMVLAGFHAGTPLMSFVGHSSPGQWDFDPLLTWQDVDNMTNVAHPNLVAQWGCWNSYYVEPAFESLSAHLLRAEGGAAAAVGASTLLPQGLQQQLGMLFLAQIDHGGQTVGEALNAAKRDLLKTGAGHDVVLGTILLGDPAMSLPAATP